jgi:DNA-binding MarR family transcriptional regulator/GNAT superfamily N-acetyltransferase
MLNTVPDERIQAVRQFTRFYTKQIGVLQEGLLGSNFSLTEARVLYELAHREDSTASDIGSNLGLDAGYLSRILSRFVAKRLIRRERSRNDGRHFDLSLTAKGRSLFESLNRQSSVQVAEMLNRLSDSEQKILVQALQQVERTLAKPKGDSSALVLRAHRAGDMGWVIQRHGALYTQEYGWDESFEALVAEIAAQFIKNFDPRREHCWIAERHGEPVGSIFLVKHTDEVAKLRLLLVEPHARGLGVGSRLVEECIQFARSAGYRKMVLWTQSILTPARKIYERAGFKLVKEEPHHSFGADLVGETWELELPQL